MNGWHTSSRCQAARIHPCLFGCDGKRDNLHHYIICPNLFDLCKFLNKGVSHMPLERIGLCNPSHETMVHMCCAYGAYHSLINYVNCLSDTFFIGSTEKLVIKASNKAWSVFAEAYRAGLRVLRSMHLTTHFLHGLSGDTTLRILLLLKKCSPSS